MLRHRRLSHESLIKKRSGPPKTITKRKPRKSNLCNPKAARLFYNNVRKSDLTDYQSIDQLLICVVDCSLSDWLLFSWIPDRKTRLLANCLPTDWLNGVLIYSVTGRLPLLHYPCVLQIATNIAFNVKNCMHGNEEHLKVSQAYIQSYPEIVDMSDIKPRQRIDRKTADQCNIKYLSADTALRQQQKTGQL